MEMMHTRRQRGGLGRWRDGGGEGEEGEGVDRG